MTSNFAFHPTVNEVVPFSAQYSFPNQATRQSKRTVKVTPKNNSTSFSSGSVIRFEFPASGYLNPNNTCLAFNARCNITGGSFTLGATLGGGFEFQQNIASIFRRVRILYGSLVLEDIQDYNILQRMFTEITMPSGSSNESQSLMYMGIGPHKYQASTAATTPFPLNYNNQRFNYHATGTENVETNVGITPRRYIMSINTGLFQQHNLIPLKFMANQLQVEFEIADAADCVIWTQGTGAGAAVPSACQVLVGLPEIVAELLEFDSEFDAAVYDILGTGLPIYFQSWHMTTQYIATSLINQLNIQETARSVRYCLAVLLDDAMRTIKADAHTFYAGLQNTNPGDRTAATTTQNNCLSAEASLIESFQWRLGGTYYPSQPVPCYFGTTNPGNTTVDANYTDPPVEAYSELMKVFGNNFGDDGTFFNDNYVNIFGEVRKNGTAGTNVNARSFVIAGNFMSDRGDIISGINAEEQNDLQLILKFVGTASGTPKTLKVATCFDNLIILGENNNLVLVN